MGQKKLPNADALRGLRSWPVKGFDDVRVYYLAYEGQVRVVRVLHGKRDINSILNEEADNTSQ
jgi:plasmid stabilization system protein ParE